MAFNYQAIINSINNFAAQHGLTMYAYTPNFKGVIEALDNLQNIQFSVEDGTIVNADVNANAAIAGTKIDPDFGSQTITTTGNLGIGTASPGSYEAGKNNFVIANTGGNAGLTIASVSSGYGEIAFADGTSGTQKYRGQISYDHTNDALKLFTAASERVHIDSQGRLNIGAINAGSNDGIFNCDINGTKFHLGFGTAFTNYYTAGSSGNHIFRCGTSEKVRINSSGNLGIGDSNPDARCVVYRQTQFAGNNAFAVKTDAGSTKSTKFLVDGNGNVGIGTTSPSGLLHLKGGGIRIQSDDDTDEKFIDFRNASDGSTRGFVSYNFADDALKFRSGGSGEKMRIDSSGRLLVGTSSCTPAFAAVFQGNSAGTDPGAVCIAGDTTTPADTNLLGALDFSDSNKARSARIAAHRNGGTWTSGSSQPTYLAFSTTANGASSPTERMRISSEGIVYHISTNHGYHLGVTAAAGTTKYIYRGHRSATAGTFNSGTNVYTVWSNGNVQNTNNSYGSLSDAKLKENIVDASSQWDDIKNLRVRNYNFIEGQTHTQIGVVAQEVEAVSPGLVYESPDQDQEGNDLGTVTKSVNYSVLYMKAVKALQEAMDRIETLEQRLFDAGIA